MTQEHFQHFDFEPEKPLLDVKLINPLRKIVARTKESLDVVGMFVLLLILAASVSVKHLRAPQPNVPELHREYGDGVDR